MTMNRYQQLLTTGDTPAQAARQLAYELAYHYYGVAFERGTSTSQIQWTVLEQVQRYYPAFTIDDVGTVLVQLAQDESDRIHDC